MVDLPSGIRPEGFVSPRDPVPSRDPSPTSSRDTVAERYEAYRVRQAELLPTLIPREGIRPLYRAALEWAEREGLAPGKDPLALLRQFCEVVLPLPPLEVWAAEYGGGEALSEPEEDGTLRVGERRQPVLVDLRSIEHEGASWAAGLTVQRVEPGWSGYIHFADGVGRAVRTADIFREDTLAEVRQRFASLERNTLTAFLRSALP